MQFAGLGTVVMFGVAAVLWFAYLVPVWFRRREYLATERNATRLQQTLRIMAETAEVPDTVRAEATARGAAHQERLLREREREQAARERAALLAARRAADRAAATARRGRAALRRRRLAASLGLLVALGTAGVQGALSVAASDLSTTAMVVLAAAAVVGLVSVSALRSLAKSAGAIPAPVAEAPVASAPTVPVQRRERGWTPVPVPKPLYLGTPAPQPVRPVADADRLMREASESARAALRVAHREAEVVAFPAAQPAPAASVPAAPSRWAAMGHIGDIGGDAPDLDEVLRRRRAAG